MGRVKDDIQDQCNVSTDDVLCWLDTWGVPVRGRVLHGVLRAERGWCEQNPPKVIASRFGVPTDYIHNDLRRAGVTAAPGRRVKYRRRIHGPPTPLALRIPKRWRNVDWTKRNCVIAKQLGVCGERVRQMRNRLGMPKPEGHGVHPTGHGPCQVWMRRHTEWCYGRTAQRIADESGFHVASIRNVAKALGIELGREKQIPPMNFDLPNGALNQIWGYRNSGTMRQRYGHPAKWEGRKRHNNNDPSYREAVKAEEAKAREWNHRNRKDAA